MSLLKWRVWITGMIRAALLLALLGYFSSTALLLTEAAGAATAPTTVLQVKAPFWRQQPRPCGVTSNGRDVRPNSCPSNHFCYKDPYQSQFEVCVPCWRACLQCARWDTQARNDSGITRAECIACGCSISRLCGSSRTCWPGTYCDSSARSCISCYECVEDQFVLGGTCRSVCGVTARKQLPSTFGLPYDEADKGASTEWVVDAVREVTDLYDRSNVELPVSGWLSMSSLLSSTGLDLPPAQLMYIVQQLARPNASTNGYVPDTVPWSPSPPPSPPLMPWTRSRPPPEPASSPGTSPVTPAFTPPQSPPTVPSQPAPDSARARRRSQDRRLNRELLGDARLRRLRRQLQAASASSSSVNTLLAAVYPEDFVRVFLYEARDQYDIFCPPDAALLATGQSFPGCACMAIPPEYQDDTTLVTGLQRMWVDYLALAASRNTTTVNAVCPQGYRCSKPNFANMRHLFARAYLPPVMGICTRCLVTEYCPVGTVEKSKELVEACSHRSVLLSGGTGAGSSNSSSSGGSDDCGNTRLCPAGSYCPSPSEVLNCTLGGYCTLGSTEATTCSFDAIINQMPFATIKPQPKYVLSQVTAGSPLSGNYCPEGSEDPFSYCPAGYYCPQPGIKTICPKGHFCPAQSTEPQLCGFLLSCDNPGTSKPQIATWGVLVFIILLLLLPVAGILYNIYEERVMRRTVHDDRLLEALSAMGFGAASGDPEGDPDGEDEDDFAWWADASARSWWQKARKWFRRRVLGRQDKPPLSRGRSASAPVGSAAVRSGKSSGKMDVEGLMQLGADALPPGFNSIHPYLTIQFENLSLKLKSGRRILDNVCGDFPHSHLHAIMGPSGSGKSSFITALIGKAGGGNITGNVAVWRCEKQEEDLGEPCSFEQVRYLTGFVPQDDVVHETMTVRDNLIYSAALRLPRSTPRSQREAAVRGVLSMLGMAHVQYDVVGSAGRKGLSGGQRKRLNIGLELVAKPCLLMLDEPTSGLDAAVSHDVVLALKHMAEAGMNVMVVIHQPRYSIFEMFDSVLLLGVGGRTVFLGPVNLAEAYFNFLGFRPPPNENRADFYLDVISGAVWRDSDEDFVPNELFTVWQEVGRMWLISKLTDPNFGEEDEDEQAMEDEFDEQGQQDEDGYSHPHRPKWGSMVRGNFSTEYSSSQLVSETLMACDPLTVRASNASSLPRSRRSPGRNRSHRGEPADAKAANLSVGGPGYSSVTGGGYSTTAYEDDDDTVDPSDAMTPSFRTPQIPVRTPAVRSTQQQQEQQQDQGYGSGADAYQLAGVVVGRTSSASSSGGGVGLRSPHRGAAARRLVALWEHAGTDGGSTTHQRSRFAPTRSITASPSSIPIGAGGEAASSGSPNSFFAASPETVVAAMATADAVSSAPAPNGSGTSAPDESPSLESVAPITNVVYDASSGHSSGTDGTGKLPQRTTLPDATFGASGGGGRVPGQAAAVVPVPTAAAVAGVVAAGDGSHALIGRSAVAAEVTGANGSAGGSSGWSVEDGAGVSGAAGEGSPATALKVLPSSSSKAAEAAQPTDSPKTAAVVHPPVPAAAHSRRRSADSPGAFFAAPGAEAGAEGSAVAVGGVSTVRLLGSTEVPASRRFLAKVHSLHRAGVDSLEAVSSVRAREVLVQVESMVGGPGSVAAMERRSTGKATGSSAAGSAASIKVSQQLETAAGSAERLRAPEGPAAGEAEPHTAVAERPEGAVQLAPPQPLQQPQPQPGLPVRRQREHVIWSRTEGGAGQEPGVRARAQWGRLRNRLASAAGSTGPNGGSGGQSPAATEEIQPARLEPEGGGASTAKQRWQRINSKVHQQQQQQQQEACKQVPDSNLRATGEEGSGAGPASNNNSGAMNPAGATPQLASLLGTLQMTSPGGGKLSFWDVAIAQLERSRRERERSAGGDGGGGGAAREGGGPGAPGDVQAKRGPGAGEAPGTQPPALTLANILKMSKDVQQRRAADDAKAAGGPRKGGAAGPRAGKDGAGGGLADTLATTHTTLQVTSGFNVVDRAGDENRRSQGGMLDTWAGGVGVGTAQDAAFPSRAAGGKGPAAGRAAVLDILKIAREAARKEVDKERERERDADEAGAQGRSLLDAYRQSMKRERGDVIPLSDSMTEPAPRAGGGAGGRGLAGLGGSPIFGGSEQEAARGDGGAAGGGGGDPEDEQALLGEVPMLQDDEEGVEAMVKRIYAEKPRLTHLSKVVPWRPKDLQAIQENFDLIDVGGNKALSYDEFLYFFAALRKLLPEQHFRRFVEETIEQFHLQEGSVVTRDEFLAGIKARLKEGALPAELRLRRYRRLHHDADRTERRRRLDLVLRRIRKLKKPPEELEEGPRSRSLGERLSDLREYFRRKNASITRKHLSTRAAKAAGVANPLVAARLHSIVAPKASKASVAYLPPGLMAPAWIQSGLGAHGSGGGEELVEVVMGGQTLLLSQVGGEIVVNGSRTQYSTGMYSAGGNSGGGTRYSEEGAAPGQRAASGRPGEGAAAAREQAGMVGAVLAPSPQVWDAARSGSNLGQQQMGTPVASRPFLSPFAAAPSEFLTSPAKDQAAASHAQAPPGRAGMTSVSGLPNRIGAILNSPGGSSVTGISHFRSAEVEMSVVVGSGNDNGAAGAAAENGSVLSRKREQELSFMLHGAGGSGDSVSAGGGGTTAGLSDAMSPQTSPSPHILSGGSGSLTSPVGRSGGSVTRLPPDDSGRGLSRFSRRLQVVLTNGGRVSTDIADQDINQVLTGRISKSITGAGRGTGATSNSGVAGRRSGSGDATSGPLPSPRPLSPGAAPSIGSPGLAGFASGTALASPGGADPSPQLPYGTSRAQSATVVVAAQTGDSSPTATAMARVGSAMAVASPGQRTGSITAMRVGSITAGLSGRVGSVTGAVQRVGSLTAGALRVASITAAGAHRAPGVMVIGGGRVGSITATGRVASITAAQVHGPTARRRRRQSYYRAGAIVDPNHPGDPGDDDASDVGGMALLGMRALMVVRADKEQVQSVLARLRAERNIDPALLKQQEQQAQAAARAAQARQRRQSYVIPPEQQAQLDAFSGQITGMPVAGTSAAGDSNAGGPAPGVLSIQLPSVMSGSGPLTSRGGRGSRNLAHGGGLSARRVPQREASNGGIGGSDSPTLSHQGTSRVGVESGMDAPPALETPRLQSAAAAPSLPPWLRPDSTEPRMVAAGPLRGITGDVSMAPVGDDGYVGATLVEMEDEGEESINCCVLLSYYISYYSTVTWSWLSLRASHFIASLLGHERGGRALPSVGRQIYLIFRRSATKFLNERAYALLDISLVIMLGLVMGAIQGHTSSITKVPETSILVILAFAITSLVTGLRTFGQEQLIFLIREAQAGLSVMSWMAGRMSWDVILQALYPALYLGFYYAMTVFDTPFELYYLVLLFVAWWGFGVGYLFSVLLESNNALLGGLCVTLIFGGIINGINPSVAASSSNILLKGLQYLSYTRWAVEAVFIGTATPTPKALVFLTAGAMSQLGFCEMDKHVGSLDGFLEPAAIISAFGPILGARYNTTFTTSGNSTSSISERDSVTLAFLYRVYEDPEVVDKLCRHSFVMDIVWLFVWGVVTRMAAYWVLLYKVERRMTTASVFG